MYRDIADYYKYIFPASPEQEEFFRRLFVQKGVKRVLDVACGSGEQLEVFGDMGLNVDGIELEEAMVDLIRRKFDHRSDKIRVKMGNMLDAARLFPGPYDAVVCIGNSLVHLSGIEQIKAAVSAMAVALVPGGLVIIQIVNYDRILHRKVTSLSTIEAVDDRGGPVSFQRKYDLSGLPGTIHFETTLTAGGRTITGATPLFPLQSSPLSALTKDAGFIDPVLYGGYDFSSFAPESQGCIIVATRGPHA
jgi:SAM-dependent methyltransferase